MPDTTRPDDALLELAYPYALDAVTDPERRTIERRLATSDPETSHDFDEIVHDVREAMGSLAILDAQAAPPEVEARILARLDDSPARGDRSGPIPLARRYRRLRWVAAAAAAVAAVAVCVGVLTDRAGEHPPNPTAAENILRQPDTRATTAALSTGGNMTVHASPGLGAALVSFETVPGPPAGRVYQLWLVPPEGQPQSAGVLTRLPTPTTPLVTKIATTGKLAVTIEPDGGSTAPTTEPLGAVALG
ncbi:anti-sigma factor domain-containing protein [Nocardia sp. BMG51109]|uniref:anti-sigma factor n=1 Tax=Nocardia sp. BMG51109 TaxID=1056816 RepID=UPI0004673285|nr:anti-sigma factor [Nocardia sp. BMG51109]